MSMHAVILAAGMGTRLGRPWPKPLTPLADGRTISAPLAWYPRLLHATPVEREDWQIAGAGFGIHWPSLDEDLSVAGLLRGAPAPRQAISIA